MTDPPELPILPAVVVLRDAGRDPLDRRLGASRPALRRLKQALRELLRRHGLRATLIRDPQAWELEEADRRDRTP